MILMLNQRNTFIRFLAYVRPYWKQILAASIGGIVKFTLPLYVPQVTQHLLDDVYLNPTLSQAAKLNELYWAVGSLMLIFTFFWAPWVYVRHYYAGRAGHRSVFDLRYELYHRILRMSASFFTRHKSGGVVSRLISDVALAQNLVGSALTNVWMDAAAIIVILFFMFRINLALTAVALAIFPFYLFFFRRFGDQIKTSSHKVQQEIESISGNLQEKIAGSLVVHAFSQEKTEQRKFGSDSEHLFSTTMHSVFLQSLNITITNTLTNLAPLVVTLFGGYLVIQGQLTVGELVAFGMYIGPLYLPLQRFSELNIVLANSLAALDRIFEVMDEKPEIADRPDALDLPQAAGRVEFDHVSFAYDGEHPVLHEVTFTAQPGQKIALVGHSGSGKTTITSLIPRFYDVGEGAVRLDGHDVRDIRLNTLRRHIGLVLQDPILFSGTIRENILYGNPRATWDQIAAACHDANAYDFIMALPQGFDTEVGERGVFLSGGQKQRLTIARAFVKDPTILILDEATSNLDSASERLIQEALERLMVNRTTFIVAHRLSTVIHADMILVLYQGRIVETGTHANLVKANGVYQRLYFKQLEAAAEGMEL
jgi:ABC-type multidrug transport system fused ATPase/permease subunit